MNHLQWKELDKTVKINLPEETKCYYAREYIPKKGYRASETNDLISNFKRKSDKEGKISESELPHRKRAINNFAHDLTKLLLTNGLIYVTNIPCSKRRDSPKYDDRFDILFELLKEKHTNIRYVEPIVQIRDQKASHHGGDRFKPDENWEWKGFDNFLPEELLIIDDVITSGSHFRKYVDLLKKKVPTIQVYGAFWAVSRSEEENNYPFHFLAKEE